MKSPVDPLNNPVFAPVILVNTIPIIVILDTYIWSLFNIELPWQLTLVFISIIVAITDIIYFSRFVAWRKPLTSISIICRVVIVLALCYLAWVVYGLHNFISAF